jgi:hypothetical protein
MDQSRVVILTIVALIGAHAAAQAGPCTTQIAQLQTQIGRLATGPEGGPSGPQSIGAQLHHQPTPGAVQHAQAAANADADAALDRARKADAQSDSRGCQDALRQARELYGLDVK